MVGTQIDDDPVAYCASERAEGLQGDVFLTILDFGNLALVAA
jgi:hypothetical protein